MKYIILVLLTFNLFADQKYKEFTWGDIPVVWIKNDNVPKFYLNLVYFDGSFSDDKSKEGETTLTFDNLESGTSKYSQKEIAEKFDFYAASIGSQVFGDRVRISLSGMNKDTKPLMELACHVLKEANYPDKEVQKDITSRIDSIKNLVSSPRSLIRRAARYSFYRRTPMSGMSDGYIKTLEKLKSSDLRKKKDYFNKQVKKKIFLLGGDPKEIESLFSKNCSLKNGEIDRRNLISKWGESKKAADFVFIPLEGANQAQIRVGQVFNSEKLKAYNSAYTSFISNYLGGGFTGKLLNELRTKRGLVYSAGPIILEFFNYSYSAIATFTKNEKVSEVVKVINDVTSKLREKEVSKIEYALLKNKVKGSYLFDLEGASKYLSELMYLDYLKKDFSAITKFPKEVDSIKREGIKGLSNVLYSPENIEYVVLGDPSIKKQLEKLGTVQEVPLSDIL